MSTTTFYEQPTSSINLLSAQEKKELAVSDTVSLSSSTPKRGSKPSFTAVKSLHINTQGVALLRLPLPSSELTTTVLNPDGTLAYTSIRTKRSSGTCVLTDANDEPLLKTTYYFGPRKDPVLCRADHAEDEARVVKTILKWTSRSHTFLLSDGRDVTWKYEKAMGFGANGAKGTALVLKIGEKRVAALIRNEISRTPGSNYCSAGNGGELLLGQGVNGKDGLSEDLVVATCLIMLKKEIDRRRAVQVMVIAVAMS